MGGGHDARHLGHPEAAAIPEAAIEASLDRPETRTRDLGGSAAAAGTAAAEAAILDAIG